MRKNQQKLEKQHAGNRPLVARIILINNKNLKTCKQIQFDYARYAEILISFNSFDHFVFSYLPIFFQYYIFIHLENTRKHYPFKHQSHKMVKHTKKIRRQIRNELFLCV